MFNTPKKGLEFSKKVPLTGLFQDGVWHCNCQPRLPASHFQVKKEGPNTGRYFYTCQKPKDESCGFFLWAEEAVPREMRAVVNNSRSEILESSSPSTTRALNRPAPKSAPQNNSEASTKRDLFDENDDQSSDWPLSPPANLQDPQVKSESSRPALSAYPETPRKSLKTSILATPGSKRNWDESEAGGASSFPTPTTGRLAKTKTGVENTPSKIRAGGMFDGNESHRLVSTTTTPTPVRFHDPLNPFIDPANDGSETTDSELTTSVLALLTPYSDVLPPSTLTSVKEILNTHALKTQGIAKGRDITRLALKARDTKLAELQTRIRALETEGEMQRVVLCRLKGDIAESVAWRSRGKSKGRREG